MSQLRGNQKLLPYGRFMLGFQSPNNEHLLGGIAKSEQHAGNKILIGEISNGVVIWVRYPISMTFMVHSTIQCPERQPFFGIILEPKEQSIHTTNRWWKLPTHSSFRRYIVNSYDIHTYKKEWLSVSTSSCGEPSDVYPSNERLNQSGLHCTMHHVGHEIPMARRIQDSELPGKQCWLLKWGMFPLRSCLRRCFNGNWWSTTNAHK